MIKNRKKPDLFSILILSFFSCQAHAYIDPGTGSLIIQGLLAAIATSIVVLNHYWEKLKSVFKRKQPEGNENKSEQ